MAIQPVSLGGAITGISRVIYPSFDIGHCRDLCTSFFGWGALGVACTEGRVCVPINSRQSVEFVSAEAFPELRMGFVLEVEEPSAPEALLLAKGFVASQEERLFGERITSCFHSLGEGVVFAFAKPQSLTPSASGQTSISTDLGHVGFQTSDYRLAYSIFVDTLGFREVWRGGADPDKVEWVRLQLPEGGQMLELMLYEEEPSKEQVGFMNHFCVDVLDLFKVQEQLDQRNYPTECRPATPLRVGRNRRRQINYFAIDGTRIEVMEDHTFDGSIAPSSTGQLMQMAW